MTVSFELDGDTVLFAAHSGELVLLNPTATTIWSGLEQGHTTVQVADELAQATGIPADIARRDCETMIAQWQELGFLGESDARPNSPSTIPERWWVRDDPLPPGLVFTPDISRHYQIGDFRFLFRTGGTDDDQQAHDFLSHLALADGDQRATPLDLCRHEDGWLLAEHQRVIDKCPAPNGMIPLIHRNLMLAAYRGSLCMAAIHAAAVVRNNRCLLMAGVAGSGKTTLTSALLANGFKFCADDLVLLTEAPVRARGIPVRLGIKAGSWPVVEDFWPELEQCPTHLRADGKLIRYFRPGNSEPVDEPGTTYEATVVLFPRYRADASTSLREMGKGEALVMLTQAGYDFSEVVDERMVKDLVNWISGLACYQLEYNDLREAVAEIRRIFPG